MAETFLYKINEKEHEKGYKAEIHSKGSYSLYQCALFLNSLNT